MCLAFGPSISETDSKGEGRISEADFVKALGSVDSLNTEFATNFEHEQSESEDENI